MPEWLSRLCNNECTKCRLTARTGESWQQYEWMLRKYIVQPNISGMQRDSYTYVMTK